MTREQRSLVFAVLFIFLLILTNAYGFEKELVNFLSSRKPTFEEETSGDIIVLELREGQKDSTLFAIPRITAHAFATELCIIHFKFEELNAFCDTFIKSNPNDNDGYIWFMNALALEMLGRLDEAIVYHEKIVKFSSDRQKPLVPIIGFGVYMNLTKKILPRPI
ncbi:MAG: hypothetical protein NC912_05125 [Candidatus Omnitrophica bacterium]|nr:hypothetical protein [Candidatus Omnitrophota bacterium]